MKNLVHTLAPKREGGKFEEGVLPNLTVPLRASNSKLKRKRKKKTPLNQRNEGAFLFHVYYDNTWQPTLDTPPTPLNLDFNLHPGLFE